MSLSPLFVLGSLGAFALVARATSSKRTTSGEVELSPGVRYRLTYVSSRPITLSEASELLLDYPITALSVAPTTPGYWQVAFEAAPTTVVKGKIGVPLTPDEPRILLAEVLRLG